jgi:hypothetical protein
MNDKTEQMMDPTEKRRKGQTLAEFAITLPILLLLLFGIVEFGRIFQAWVTLQNSARAAARFAITGQYDESRYDLDEIVPCDPDPVLGPGQDLRGTLTTSVDDLTRPYEVQYYTGAEESLFASWFSGANCDRGNDNHLEWRKDILRIVSIYDEARRGAGGLAIEDTRVEPTAQGVRDYLFSVWNNPLPGVDNKQWFNVMICSTRAKFDVLASTYDPSFSNSRFITIFD